MRSVSLLTAETVIPINHAPKHYPYGRANISTVYRHFGRGCRGIRLETFLAGGRRYTTVEAIERFFEAITAAADGDAITTAADGDSPPTPTPRQREREISHAEREFDVAMKGKQDHA
jgi:hypothetical protein